MAKKLNIFCTWCHIMFQQHHQDAITDLFIDLRDGNRLLSLLEVLTSKFYVSISHFFRYKSMSNAKIID